MTKWKAQAPGMCYDRNASHAWQARTCRNFLAGTWVGPVDILIDLATS